jgi:transposase
VRLIDELDREIGECERELRRLGADHRYVPLPLTVPGIGWVLAYTIAAEPGDINRFPSPRKLAGYSGLCPRAYQSGERDLRGPLAKQGPRYAESGELVQEAASGGVKEGELFSWERRPVLLKLIDLAERHEFDVLLVARLDRLSRD